VLCPPPSLPLSLITYFGFKDAIWEGAVLCDPNASYTGAACLPGGFMCAEDPTQCYGRTGAQVLTTAAAQFDMLSTSPNVAVEVVSMLAFGLAFKIAFTLPGVPIAMHSDAGSLVARSKSKGCSS
jgi:hypothetical protein